MINYSLDYDSIFCRASSEAYRGSVHINLGGNIFKLCQWWSFGESNPAPCINSFVEENESRLMSPLRKRRLSQHIEHQTHLNMNIFRIYLMKI